jgi:hypothetical protein
MDAGSSKSTRQRPRKSRELNLAAIESLMVAVTDMGDTACETLGRSLTADEAKSPSEFHVNALRWRLSS